ncbi:MAG: sulfatase [Candidatus Hydrogenedentes bacterium]|nr:sulfatase [Candidatus Hydrogenedentota bacterium]
MLRLRTVLPGILAIAMVALLNAGCGSPSEEVAVGELKRPNLILISIDTLRADFLGCYGYDRPTSPSIDRFAAQGVLFEDVTAPSPWTPPSHASMLTGLYPNHHGLKPKDHKMMRDAIRTDTRTLAEVLQERGYRTGAFLSSTILRGDSGFARGFDDFVSINHGVERAQPSGVRKRAEAWLKKARGDTPFFLFLHFYDVHSDYRSLPRYEKMFLHPYDGIADGSTKQLLSVRNGDIPFGKADADHTIDLYCAGIRQMDDQFDRLMKYLDKLRLSESTVVILTSDHGEEFLEHGSVLHGRSLFEELVRVPLIVRGPGLPQGTRLSAPVSLVDIMPTVLSLLDVTFTEPLDGIDLAPLWGGDSAPAVEPRFLFAEADWGNENPDIKRAVRHGNHKLHYDRDTGRTELYNLAQDPGERTDIAEGSPDIVATLRARLDEFMESALSGPLAPEWTPEELEELESLGYLE